MVLPLFQVTTALLRIKTIREPGGGAPSLGGMAHIPPRARARVPAPTPQLWG